MNPIATLSLAALALGGSGLATLCGDRLAELGGFTFEPNPLGIKHSPYGQVLALGVQGGVESDWHALSSGPLHPDGRACGADCGHASDTSSDTPDHLIERLELITSRRTNPNPPTPAHRRYMRREIEQTLRLAYQLDPSHYGNYNSYHLFLLHDQLGTSSRSYQESCRSAIELADATTRYGLRELCDPRPSLTAATASQNKLTLMLENELEFPLESLQQQLGVINFCLRRHAELMEAAMEEDGMWHQLSPVRQAEIVERGQFTARMRDTAAEAIRRLESETYRPQPLSARDPS